VAAVYSLWLVQRSFQGSVVEVEGFRDFGGRELSVQIPLALGLVWLGLDPQRVFALSAPFVDRVVALAGIAP